MDNLVFSSKWGGAGNILLQGFQTLTNTATTYPPYAQDLTFTITYGETYTYFPMIFATITDSSNGLVYAYNSYSMRFMNLTTSPKRNQVIADIGLSSAVMSVAVGTNRTVGIRYYVLAINGGV
jgi:hypothetical protein